MKLHDFYEKKIRKGWILWKENAFSLVHTKPLKKPKNRETLAHVYMACVEACKAESWEEANRLIRFIWIQENPPTKSASLPRIIDQDGFLRMYALGQPLCTELFFRIWERINDSIDIKKIDLHPICIEWNEESALYFDENATPPGLLPKLFITHRLKKDKEQLSNIYQDLARLAYIQDDFRRQWLTLAILSHGAAYREIEGKILKIPSFKKSDQLVAYRCHKHLIAEGVRTISMVPMKEKAIPIYLCQGTELWPSQPSMIGSIMANFATHGSATAAYAHSWRRIHKHLRDLYNGELPFVVGHSMGGSLAIQIGLYSHDLIHQAHAFNPPNPNRRDYEFYRSMDEIRKRKILISANLDDFAFWRVGEKVIGNVTVFLGKKRWRYYPVYFIDCILLIPAIVKFMFNIWHAFPAHQHILPLSENWLSFHLTEKEIEQENKERAQRFDYLHFFPKLYDPMKSLFCFLRKFFKWRMEAQYLRNEIEIITLHERDLIDMINDENHKEIMRELRTLQIQKEHLRQKLFRN
ncbi:MAG: hypothetical protein R3E91_00865 [Chlamydiales bacterium]